MDADDIKQMSEIKLKKKDDIIAEMRKNFDYERKQLQKEIDDEIKKREDKDD